MRLPLVVPATLGVFVASACAHPEHTALVPVSQITAGSADAFGTGVTSATASRLTLHLTDAAYAAVVRVLPGYGAELMYTSRRPLAPGAQSIRVPGDRLRTWVPNLPSYTLLAADVDSRFNNEPACLMKHARYEAERPRVPNEPGAVPPLPEPRCIPTQPPRVQPDTRGPGSGRWVMGAPLPLGDHYLVVIASTTPFDHDGLAQWLGELDISRVRGEAAARAMPEYLMGEGGRWGAWIVRVP